MEIIGSRTDGDFCENNESDENGELFVFKTK